MKFLFITKNRIAQYFVKNKVIFIIFIIGGILNSSVFSYMYGNLNPKTTQNSLTDVSYRIYKVYFNVNVDEYGWPNILEPTENYVTSSDTEKILNTGLFESCVKAYSPERPSDGYTPSEQSYSIGTILFGSIGIKYRGVLELNTDSDILLHCFETEADIDDEIKLHGQCFTVRGIYSSASNVDAVITSKAFDSLGLPVNYIQCVSFENWNLGQPEGDAPFNTLTELFPDAYIVSYGASQSANAEVIAKRGVEETVLTYVVSTIAFIFLLVFMADSLSEENISSIIVGAGTTGITLQVFFEGLLLSTATVLIGLLTHALLYTSLFSKINVSEGVYYLLGDYFTMALIMIAINAIVMAIVSSRYMMQTAAKLRTKR